MPPALVLFDCDGTLVDSEYLNNLAVLETLEEFGAHGFDMDYALTHFMGLRFSRILELVTQATGQTFPDHIRACFLEKIRVLAPLYMKEIAGARGVIIEAQSRGKACVVSNGEHNNVVSSLRDVGLLELFDPSHIYTGLMAPNPKPAPDLYLMAASKMGVEPARCLVIEDSIAGVTAGLAAGMEVWAFCGTHHDAQAHGQGLLELGASKAFHSMVELKAALIPCPS